ncbi:PQQ-dependent sugar dehydrogenase [Microbaculum marinum]|uniref:PQQ-dependent sugar dehydrogenase n=1 Tax=Microbaculum marinum TaxID=1764581 RepID=A0AAW9RKD1_9HYPH
MSVTGAPGFRKLVFVVEQGGTIRVLRKETPLDRPFLNISKRVLGPPDDDAGNEQGLLSMAFAPDYGRSGRFYVAYTSRTGDLEIEEFRRSARSGRRADRSSRRHILTVPHRDAPNHNGGHLQFGPDGYLYISTGDGGGTGDPRDNARRTDRLLGKILRIDPTPGRKRPYRIPRSNPFRGKPGLDEIYAYGLRNPWRFSLHGNKIFVADVGQARWEEINSLRRVRAAGANFGWPQYEGKAVFDADRPGADPVTFPALVYSHDDGGCSVTGGYVVTDPTLPDLAGRYLYADFCLGELRSFIPRRGARDDKPVGLTVAFPTSFGIGPKGRVYVAQVDGAVLRLAPVDGDASD